MMTSYARTIMLSVMTYSTLSQRLERLSLMLSKMGRSCRKACQQQQQQHQQQQQQQRQQQHQQQQQQQQ